MSKKNFKSVGEQAVSKFFSDISTQDAHITQDAPNALSALKGTSKNQTEIQNKLKSKDKQRINLAFDEGLLDYLHIMVRLDGVSATQYINNLIHRDKEERAEEYKEIVKLFKV
jgi:predicted DNA binding CopG/RHH family protein